MKRLQAPTTPFQAVTRVLLATACAIVLALLVSSAQAADPSTAADSADFIPYSARVAYITDWDLILNDMLTAYPTPFDIEDTEFVRTLGQRHSFGARQALAGGYPDLMAKHWGWSILDIKWELEVLPGLAVIGFNDDFGLETIVSLLAERGYQRNVHLGQVTYQFAGDEKALWILPPFNSYKNVALLPEERIMLLSTTRDGLEVMLETAYGVAARWPGAELAADLSGKRDTPSALWVLMPEAICGLQPGQSETLAYTAAAVGYGRIGKTMYGALAFQHQSVEEAEADLQVRKRLILPLGPDGGNENPDFYQWASTVRNAAALLVVSDLSSPNVIFDRLMRLELEAMACPVGAD